MNQGFLRPRNTWMVRIYRRLIMKTKKRRIHQKASQFRRITSRYTGWSTLSDDAQIPVINSDTDTDFWDQFVSRRCPVVIRNYAACKTKNEIFESLRSMPTLNVEVERKSREGGFGCDNTGTRPMINIRNLPAELETGNLYLSTQPLPEDDVGPTRLCSTFCEHLLQAFDQPLQPGILSALVPYQVNTWLGSSGPGGAPPTSSGLHHDYHDNLYVLLSGQKTFRLFSPDCLGKTLRTHGCARSHGRQDVRVHANGLICYDPLTCEDGSPDEDNSEAEEIILEMALDSSSLQDVTGPPLSFSAIGNAADIGGFAEVTFSAGDALYLPASFFHEVLSSAAPGELHLALNYWFYPPVAGRPREQPYLSSRWRDRWLAEVRPAVGAALRDAVEDRRDGASGDPEKLE